MTDKSLEAAVRSVLLSRNERRIRAFALQWGIFLPKKPTLFWAHVNRFILNLEDVQEEERKEARAWLRSHGLEV